MMSHLRTAPKTAGGWLDGLSLTHDGDGTTVIKAAGVELIETTVTHQQPRHVTKEDSHECSISGNTMCAHVSGGRPTDESNAARDGARLRAGRSRPRYAPRHGGPKRGRPPGTPL